MKMLSDYDINGDYIKHWLPELRHVPPDKLFQPWLLTAEEQARYSVRIGPGLDYPAPDSTPYRGGVSSEGGDGKRNTRPDPPKRGFTGTSSPRAEGAIADKIAPSGSLGAGKEGTNRKFKRVQHF